MRCPSSKIFPSAIALVIATHAAPAAAVDDGTWVNLAPIPRISHAAIYDPVRHRLLTFGGNDASRRNEVWALNLVGVPGWVLVPAGGTAPSRRSGASLIYDPVRDRLVLYGGFDTAARSDVWELTLSGTIEWHELAPLGTGPARSSHTATYDPVRDRMLVFGGSSAAGTDEVWQLTLGGTPEWSVISIAGAAPSPRFSHTTIYDAPRDRLLVFGGSGATLSTNDVWQLTLSDAPDWKKLSTSGTSPAARQGHTAIYDPVRDRMLIFGGRLASGLITTEEWELSLSGTPTWISILPPGPIPLRRSGHVAIYDPVADRMLVHGGGTRTASPPFPYLDDLWEQALTGTQAWSLVEPAGRSAGLREGAAAIADPARDRIVLFGGCTPTGDMSCAQLNDLLAFDIALERWTPLAPIGTPPPPMFYASAMLDASRDRMLVWNGGTSIWELTFSPALTWSAIPTSGLETPSAGQAILDPTRDRVLAFGSAGGFMAVWTLPLTGPAGWSTLVAQGTPPSARTGAALVLDPVTDRVLLIDGGFYLNEVWALTLADPPTWTQLTPTGTAPQARRGMVAIHDPVRQRAVLYSGGRTASYVGDAWALSLTGPLAWSALAPQGGPTFGREGAVGVYDAQRDRLIVFTGTRRTGFETFDYTNDSWALQWSPVVGVAPSPSPAAVALGMPYPNPARGALAVPFTLSRAGSAELRLYDITGRRVKRWGLGALPAGAHSVSWNLRAGSGASLGSGLYVLELASGGERVRRRIALLD